MELSTSSKVNALLLETDNISILNPGLLPSSGGDLFRTAAEVFPQSQLGYKVLFSKYWISESKGLADSIEESTMIGGSSIVHERF